jgi:aminoglycoside phosphotransferase (APT) family kinase protein
VTFGLCQDETVNGRPFYVMEFVEGHIVRDAETAERDLDGAARRRAGESIADTLAALHAVDVDAVGLGDFAKREGYIERQLRRWYEQFRNSAVEGVDTTTIISRRPRPAGRRHPGSGGDGHRPRRLPARQHRARSRRCRPGRARLGDLHPRRPLADVGLLMVYWTEAGDEAALLGVTPPRCPVSPVGPRCGALPAASGRDLGRLDFYVAFGYWKLACILQGVYARYVGGATAGDRSSVEGFATSIVRLAEMAQRTLDAS